ncbi:hypothetical protein [Clostridium sp.]|uniref:hypothetical protein n=1 Tax=Clostridium sp. TaxID=1506 RepID=UPI003464D979
MPKNEVVIIATVSASLKMFDQMTRPLQQVTQALHSTVSAMDKLSNSANKDIKITNTLNSTNAAIQKTNTGLSQLASSQNKATKTQNDLNNSFNKGSQSAGGLTGKVKGLVGTYLGFQAVREGITATIGGAMGLQQQLFTLQGIMGNKDVGTAYFDNLQKKANESVFAFEDFASNARKFMQFTKNTDSLDKLANLSERLTLMDPTQGLEGAGFALKEAMSGDFVSLKERFGFGKADAEILKASKSMDEFISKFDTLLNKKGFTESMLEQYNQSAAAQFDNLKSNFKTALAEAGNGALEILAPVFTKLNEAFSNGGFQEFFNSIGTGLSIITIIALGFINVISGIGVVVQNNWGIIQPILIAIIIYLAYILIPILWNAITTVAAMAIAWMMVNWPIMLVIGAIAIFIYILNSCGVTAEQIAGFIGGVFGVLFAFLGNLFVTGFNLVIDIIALIYNKFAIFAEFLANVFVDPIGAIVRLFAGMADSVLGILESIASAIDTIFGSNLADAVNGWRDGLQGAVDDLVGESKIKVERMDSSSLHMDRLNYGNEFKYGYKKGSGAITGIKDMFKVPDIGKSLPNPDLGAWNKTKGPGELSMGGGKSGGKGKGLNDANKHLKNIDDKIDVSNEHLEMMRDLAEAESIQNFVTLTPTVQVTTGDIKEEADINKIISKIESYMETELVNSAEGVYA